MVFYHDVEVVVNDDVCLVDEAQLVSILILQLIGLQVAKHSGSWEVVCKPVRGESGEG